MKSFVIDENKQNTWLSVLKGLLPLTFVFKMWFLAELQYNYIAQSLGAFGGRFIAYLISGMVAYILCLLAVSLSYNSFCRSKYSPCDQMQNCKISKKAYMIISYSVICVANILCGILNFVAVAAPISISFIVILLPTILSVFSVVAIVAIMNKLCQKGEFKQLMTAMAWPCIILLLLLR